MKKSQGNKLTFINSKFFLFVVVFEVSILFLLINNQFLTLYLAFLAAQFLFTTTVAAKKLQHLKTETEKCLSNYHKRISEDEQYIHELLKENGDFKADNKKSGHASQSQNTLTGEKENIVVYMAHELRNPLNSMIGFSTVILNDDYEIDKNELKEMVGIIHNSSRKLLNLIDNIIHISADKYTLTAASPDYCDITHTLQAVSSVGKGLTKKREDILLKPDIQNKLPEVYADERVLGKALSSILEHTVNYTENGEIVFKAFGKRDCLNIQISNTGNTETLKNIFFPFLPKDGENIEYDELSTNRVKDLTKFEFTRYSLLKMDASIAIDTDSENKTTLTIQLKSKGQDNGKCL